MSKAAALVEQYCFASLGSEAVIVRVVSENMQSKRVAEKCGYKYHSKKKMENSYKINYIKIHSDKAGGGRYIRRLKSLSSLCLEIVCK